MWCSPLLPVGIESDEAEKKKDKKITAIKFAVSLICQD
jgi:hypothetical protein